MSQKADTSKVLVWLEQALAALDADTSDTNTISFVTQLQNNKEVIVNALYDALQPEFRGVGKTISELMGVRVPEEEGDMGQEIDS